MKMFLQMGISILQKKCKQTTEIINIFIGKIKGNLKIINSNEIKFNCL